MKRTYFSSLVIAMALLTVGCENKKKSEVKETKKEVVDVHNSQNSLDWEGTYFGELPCASCPGINTLITLNSDGTYEKVVEYKEQKDGIITTKGTIVWKENKTQILLGDKLYKVGEEVLFCLDKEGKKITGELVENYILTKTTLEPPLDSNEGYTLQLFKGNDNKDYNVVFNTNPKVPTALIETKGFQKTLLQTEAWAKGAEYSGADTKLTVQGDKATLVIGKNKIELKQK